MRCSIAFLPVVPRGWQGPPPPSALRTAGLAPCAASAVKRERSHKEEMRSYKSGEEREWNLCCACFGCGSSNSAKSFSLKNKALQRKLKNKKMQKTRSSQRHNWRFFSLGGSISPSSHTSPAKHAALLHASLLHFSGCSQEEKAALISALFYFIHYIYCFLLHSFITNAHCALKLIFLGNWLFLELLCFL